MAKKYSRTERLIIRPDSDADRKTIQDHLERILRSPVFNRSPRMQRFLTFIVNESLAGRASGLKEYNIAISVFDKPPDFDPATSAAVRVEAGRLRRLLKQYRAEQGASDSIALEMPKGSYVPTFRRVDVQQEEDQPERMESSAKAAGQSQSPVEAWPAPEERRTVTAISCAFGGDRGFSEHSVASAFISSFDAFHERCASVAEQYGGALDGGASDRVMIYFGWPEALEDSAGRALTAALELLNAVQREFGNGPLGVRMGVATSEVVIRKPARTETFARPFVVGEAPSTATKTLLKAPFNSVLVAESTRRLTGASFEFIPAGAHGNTQGEPLLLWRLLGEKPVTRFQASAVGPRGPVIGRKEEAELLISRWHLSRQGEGQGVALVGDAGIGKSKLAESVLNRVVDESAQIRLQCSSHHANSALYPVIELLRRELDRSAQGVSPDERLTEFLLRFGLREPLERELLRTLLSWSGEKSMDGLSASQQKDLTLAVLANVLRTQAARHPTALLIEDIHWADPTTLDLLQDVIQVAKDSRLLVVMTSRQELQGQLARFTNITSIRLTRLPKSDCGEIIDAIPGAASLPAAVRTQILERAEGIPLFLEELTKLFLTADETDSTGASIPQSLSGLLASQLGRLGSSMSIAQLAAVIGRQFTREMLAIASRTPPEYIDPAIDQLLAAGVIVRQSADPRSAFSFRHALLRDASYGSIVGSARRALHYEVGRMLIESFPETAAEHPEIVARHMTDAGRNEEAISFWINAGRKAARGYALAEASADFRMALEALKTLPDSIENRELELDVLRELGLVIRSARGYGDQELAAIYERARSLSIELGKREQLANAVYGLWTHAAGCGHWQSATMLASEFEKLSREMKDDGQLEVEACRLLGASAAFTGKFSTARRYFEQALATYDPRRHGPGFGFDPGAASAAYLSWTLWHLGEAELARHRRAQALEIADSKNHAPTLAMVLSWLIFDAVCEQDLDAIVVYNERLQAVCSERDCRYWQPFGAACVEWVEFRRDGDLRHLDRLLQYTEAFRERYLTSCLLLLGADICRLAGMPEQGLGIASSAARFVEDHDERVWEAECSRMSADLLLLTSKPDLGRARALFLRAIETANRQEARALASRAVTGLKDLELRMGRRDSGLAGAARSVLH